jgi:hypothetical protein
LIFEAATRPSALKILKSRRTKVVLNEFSQLFRLQLSSIFEFEIFLYKVATLRNLNFKFVDEFLIVKDHAHVDFTSHLYKLKIFSVEKN